MRFKKYFISIEHDNSILFHSPHHSIYIKTIIIIIIV